MGAPLHAKAGPSIDCGRKIRKEVKRAPGSGRCRRRARVGEARIEFNTCKKKYKIL
jgi:hypothetical protein